MNDQRNLLLAIALSLAILLGFEWLFPMTSVAPPAGEQAGESTDKGGTKTPSADRGDTAGGPTDTAATKPAPGPQQAEGTDAPPASQAPDAGTDAPTAGDSGPKGAASRQAVLDRAPRVAIDTPSLTGSINLKGARLDDLTLVKYTETVKKNSPNVTLFRPEGTRRPYFAEHGWVAGNGNARLPDSDTVWSTDDERLTPDNPVTLRWKNGQGLTFIRTISVDKHYMFTVRQEVKNTSGEPVTLYPYGLVSRTGTPDILGYYILHEGPLGVFKDTLELIDYDNLREDGAQTYQGRGGWLGITDKYWLASLIPSPTTDYRARFSYHRPETGPGPGGNALGKYQVDYLGDAREIPADGSTTATTRLFGGAKKVSLLDHYRDKYDITHFDKAVDFGWFYFLTKPVFYALHYLHGVVGNFGVAIILLTLIIKIVLFPLANKSYRSMSKMKKLQPEMKDLQERFKDDRQRMNQELMNLYKREQVSPVSGCLPIVVQIPVFFALYKVLFVTIEMRHAPFYGWIKDLSQPDPTSLFNLFGLLPYPTPDFLTIGVWPLIMGLSMWGQQKLNPSPADPMQARIMNLLPVVFTFLLARFPAGLVIYWATNNILSLIQQWIIMRRMGVSPS